MSDPLTTLVAESIKDRLSQPGTTAEDLNSVLWDLLYFRAAILRERLQAQLGSTVQGGLFRGMELLPKTQEGCYLPRLLGCYERPLQEQLKGSITGTTPRLVNIGCGIGYYAIGIKRLWPDLEVIASDINPDTRKSFIEMAALNKVSLTPVDGLSQTDLNALTEQPGTVILCDIEGEEEQLLDPSQIPNLKHCSLLVELHGSAIATLPKRFQDTHNVTVLRQGTQAVDRPDVLADIDDVDLALLQWEMRPWETPWAVIVPE